MNQRPKIINDEISEFNINPDGTSKKADKSKITDNRKNKVYTIYNSPSNPHFYTYNKLNWYKNFD